MAIHLLRIHRSDFGTLDRESRGPFQSGRFASADAVTRLLTRHIKRACCTVRIKITYLFELLRTPGLAIARWQKSLRESASSGTTTPRRREVTEDRWATSLVHNCSQQIRATHQTTVTPPAYGRLKVKCEFSRAIFKNTSEWLK